MHIFSSLGEIETFLGINRRTVMELIDTKIVPCIVKKASENSERKNYYSCDTLINASYSAICKLFPNKNLNRRDAFLLKLPPNQIFPKKDSKAISFTNVKGGVGKSICALNVATILPLFGKKVLVLDMDGQANATDFLSPNGDFDGKSIKQIIAKVNMGEDISKDDIKKFIKTVEYENVSIDFLPSELSLAKAVEVCRMNNSPHKVLHFIISKIRDEYDYIVIDTPPTPGLALQMCIFASNSVVFVSEPGKDSIKGMILASNEIKEVNSEIARKIEIEAILYNKVDENIVFHKDIADYIVKFAKNNSIKNVFAIPKSIIVEKSKILDLPLIEFKSALKDSIRIGEGFIDLAVSIIEKN